MAHPDDDPRPSVTRAPAPRPASRVVRPDSEKYTGQAPPEEIDRDDAGPAHPSSGDPDDDTR